MPNTSDGFKKPLYSFLIGSLQTIILKIIFKDNGIIMFSNLVGVLAVAEDSKYWNLFYMCGYILGSILIALFTGFDDNTQFQFLLLGVGFLDKLARK